MEIERKFLIKSIPNYIKDNLSLLEAKEIIQYYIGFAPEIRVRKSNDKYMLTIKMGEGLVRHEIEKEINEVQFNEIITFDKFPSVSKTRYNIPVDNNIIELDVYMNLGNLMTAEIEFDDVEKANNFIPPNWFDKELTGIKDFSNKNLAIYGCPK